MVLVSKIRNWLAGLLDPSEFLIQISSTESPGFATQERLTRRGVCDPPGEIDFLGDLEKVKYSGEILSKNQKCKYFNPLVGGRGVFEG